MILRAGVRHVCVLVDTPWDNSNAANNNNNNNNNNNQHASDRVFETGGVGALAGAKILVSGMSGVVGAVARGVMRREKE